MSYIAQLFGAQEEESWIAFLAVFVYAALNAPAFLVFWWWREIKTMTFWLSTLPGAEHAPLILICLTALGISCWIIDLADAQRKGGNNG
ncbi:hypothetical protein A3H10_02235 [Candidatus Uhrbacteria bacterium RIFCSPLOWO2_12_FULL_46_10]|uniref:Uncharacterized protein n=1 Tax=Candidatus Uhrbacteria bacterium RIFCSPLOWO2_01_FULL_47_25 TaxID=1802402 RepID=A0A1F7US23_9BACT|nr:MAG: hypothetical protein UX68_C0012G0015 [Parcubacteria group bacterium GW2011_GWA2_46_9]OGL61227.1 MAG: hypothetical protein A2752_00030 [Candidatus Uhrbacteria bacterium RIFCSPHIGHO2_01_FULL_46_23]OGL68347.1 MAG: hypothetical protein A3D60_00530 [Candidatus Uhrbacteria bacterium RIFCSPHIGHO2_02_FULL_47_29]OGL75033.1 MAG: hypothetical protein A3E96_00150 [Candidatus Uhrbacteria bacterium RIFCSPHIGHO2_12_FULL_46_13]OGL81035.1 MAG: hypothetical protein A2936_00335 [Candidatus Uhrbacteria bac